MKAESLFALCSIIAEPTQITNTINRSMFKNVLFVMILYLLNIPSSHCRSYISPILFSRYDFQQLSRFLEEYFSHPVVLVYYSYFLFFSNSSHPQANPQTVTIIPKKNNAVLIYGLCEKNVTYIKIQAHIKAKMPMITLPFIIVVVFKCCCLLFTLQR